MLLGCVLVDECLLSSDDQGYFEVLLTAGELIATVAGATTLFLTVTTMQPCLK